MEFILKNPKLLERPCWYMVTSKIASIRQSEMFTHLRKYLISLWLCFLSCKWSSSPTTSGYYED